MLQVKALSSLLNTKPHRKTFTTEIPLWDNAWVVFLLVALMGTAWIV